jgi:hypothetical protein
MINLKINQKEWNISTNSFKKRYEKMSSPSCPKVSRRVRNPESTWAPVKEEYILGQFALFSF